MQHPGLQKLVASQLVGVFLNGDHVFGSTETSQLDSRVFWHHAPFFVFSQHTLYEGQLGCTTALIKLIIINTKIKLANNIPIFFNTSFLFFMIIFL